MSRDRLLCRIFGHVPLRHGYSRASLPYLSMEAYTVDGMGTHHVKLSGRCRWCGERAEFAMSHLPKILTDLSPRWFAHPNSSGGGGGRGVMIPSPQHIPAPPTSPATNNPLPRSKTVSTGFPNSIDTTKVAPKKLTRVVEVAYLETEYENFKGSKSREMHYFVPDYITADVRVDDLVVVKSASTDRLYLARVLAVLLDGERAAKARRKIVGLVDMAGYQAELTTRARRAEIMADLTALEKRLAEQVRLEHLKKSFPEEASPLVDELAELDRRTAR